MGKDTRFDTGNHLPPDFDRVIARGWRRFRPNSMQAEMQRAAHRRPSVLGAKS